MTHSGRNTLSGLAVGQAMRRQVIRLYDGAPVSSAVNLLIKYKINALLAGDQDGRPSGIISKTDIMGAWYAGLPLDTPLNHIMSSPPLYCRQSDSLDQALKLMKDRGVYRLYVLDPEGDSVIGVLAYPDIVGLLYRYCRNCDFSHVLYRKTSQADTLPRLRVREVMTPAITGVQVDQPLTQVMEVLSQYRFGALLVTDTGGQPLGVISKTDLVLAFRRGLDPESPADEVMSFPIESCHEDDLLEDAIRTMIHTDVHRLFVCGNDATGLAGVISLTDAARIRSGSCHACVTSRISLETGTP